MFEINPSVRWFHGRVFFSPAKSMKAVKTSVYLFPGFFVFVCTGKCVFTGAPFTKNRTVFPWEDVHDNRSFASFEISIQLIDQPNSYPIISQVWISQVGGKLWQQQTSFRWIEKSDLSTSHTHTLQTPSDSSHVDKCWQKKKLLGVQEVFIYACLVHSSHMVQYELQPYDHQRFPC